MVLKIIFWVSFLFQFLVYAIQSVSYYSKYKGKEITSKQQKVIGVFVSFGWVAFIFMNITDPLRYQIGDGFSSILGVILLAVGLIVFMLATSKKKDFEDSDTLKTDGIYSKLRHPKYYGMILILLGLPLFTGAFYTLISNIIWLPILIWWRFLDEWRLSKLHKKFSDYKARTWF